MKLAPALTLALAALGLNLLVLAESAIAQNQPAAAGQAWRTAGATPRAVARVASNDVQAPLQSPPSQPGATAARQPLARVTRGPATLPNDAGQEWRDYDISPYTARVTTTNRPEQGVVDWILRETGHEAWHSEPLGILTADKRTLRVYHTPEMHNVVAEIVDRFVNTEAETQAFGIRIITLGSPNWRAKSHMVLKSVPVQSQGAQAWLLAKEDASMVMADMRRRSDFREHSSPHLLVHNGQSAVVTLTRPHNYIRNVTLHANAWPGFTPEQGQIDEGFSLEFNPLLSVDSRTVDCMLKCHVDQIEKMVGVDLNVPSAAAPRQRTHIEVPQMSCVRLHERFRWPVDHVMLVSLGVVASPAPPAQTGLPSTLSLNNGARSELLLFVENRGKTPVTPGATAPAAREASNYKGRY